MLVPALVLAGCSEGPPTQAELDAIAAMQRLHGQVTTNAEGHAVSLILAGAEVNDADLAPLEQLHDLKFLSLERTPIGDAGLVHLAGLTDLKSLSLAGTKVTDAGLVHLSGTVFTGEPRSRGTQRSRTADWPQLAPVTSLRKVYVSRTGPTSAGIDSLESANPRLHVTRQ